VDLRAWIEAIKANHDLEEVTGAREDTEVGVLADLLQEHMEGPAVLFRGIPDFPSGYGILTNTMISIRRLSHTLRLPRGLERLSLVKAIKDRWDQAKPLPVRWVEEGPIKENYQEKADVNLFSLPIPKLHELDGGRYLGTGCVVIMKDPDSGWINVGTYRVMLSDAHTCAMHIVKFRHGWHIRNKYWAKGEPCPVVIATGGDLLLYLMASMELPWGENEMEWTGGWREKPMAVIRGPVTGLPIPADAEIAIEGFLPPNLVKPEGPFGEWRGYYSASGREEPGVEVASLLHRHDPILVASVPRIPPNDTTYPRGFLRAALVWHQLEQARVPGITGCWVIPWGGDRPFLTVSVTPLYPGHAKQVGMLAANCPAFNYGGVVVLVMESDIDITSPEQIFWCLSTRLNPERDLHVIPGVWGNPAFGGHAAQPQGVSSRVVIDATIPWEERKKVPPLTRPSHEWAQRVKSRWPHLFTN
jgi:UbiD family decarboxylase